MPATKSAGSVRERLLEAANDLFYEEGVHTVGIDRVLERAGVAKASLYGTFGSKDELVRAYLEERGRQIVARTATRMATHEDPRARILSLFELLTERVADGSYRGCAFVNACAEGPPGPTPAREVASSHRAWRLDLLTQLATELGVADPAETGRRLSLLYDGALIGASMDGDASAPDMARALAENLLDAQAVKAATPVVHATRTNKRRQKTP